METPVFNFDDLQHKVERVAVRDKNGQLSAGEYNALLDKVRDNDSAIKALQCGSVPEEQIKALEERLKAYIDTTQAEQATFVPDDDDDPTTIEGVVSNEDYPDVTNILK